MEKKILVAGRINPSTKSKIYSEGYNIATALESFVEYIDQIPFKTLKSEIELSINKLNYYKKVKSEIEESKAVVEQEYNKIENDKRILQEFKEDYDLKMYESLNNAVEEVELVLKGNYEKRKRSPCRPVSEDVLTTLCVKHGVKPGDVLPEIDVKYYKCLENYENYLSKNDVELNDSDDVRNYLQKIQNSTRGN